MPPLAGKGGAASVASGRSSPRELTGKYRPSPAVSFVTAARADWSALALELTGGYRSSASAAAWDEASGANAAELSSSELTGEYRPAASAGARDTASALAKYAGTSSPAARNASTSGSGLGEGFGSMPGWSSPLICLPARSRSRSCAMRSIMRTARSTPPSTTRSSRTEIAPLANPSSTVCSAACASSEQVMGGSSSPGDRLVPVGRAHSAQIRMATA
jgi:hypothetical protein